MSKISFFLYSGDGEGSNALRIFSSERSSGRTKLSLFRFPLNCF